MSEPVVVGDYESNVAQIVMFLRQRCADPAFTAPDGIHGTLGIVVLDVDLVLAIADGLEEHVNVDKLPTEALIAGLAKDIVKLFVTKLFAPAKDEAERALDACETLGLTEEEIKAAVLPSTLPIWAAGLGIAGALPLIWSFLRTRARGVSTVTK